MNKKTISTFGSSLLGVLLLAGPALAQNTQTTRTETTTTRGENAESGEVSNHTEGHEGMMRHGACLADVKQYCSDVTPGEGRIGFCLKAHENKVSEKCRQSMQTKRKEFKDLRKSCQEDMDKFCKDVHMGQGRLATCLKDHMTELSQNCRTAMSKMMPMPSTPSASSSNSQNSMEHEDYGT